MARSFGKIKILVVIGTRPEAIKLAPVIKEIKKHPGFKLTVVLTSQHKEMLDAPLRLFDIRPDYNFNIMREGQNLYYVTEKVLQHFKKLFLTEKPHLVLVQGDTTTAMAASLAAFYEKTPIGHVEAGLRSFDKYAPYPEEVNRKIIDHLADFLFAPTEQAKKNLVREGVHPRKIFVTGNTVIDAIRAVLKERYDPKNGLLNKVNFDKKIVLVTSHRRENLGKPIENICLAIKKIKKNFDDLEFVFPVHPNPSVRNVVVNSLTNIPGIHVVKPLDYKELSHLMNKSHLILTDSGGIQEEATFLGKPILVLREKTERVEAVLMGNAKIVGTNSQNLIKEVNAVLNGKNQYARMSQKSLIYGDGNAAIKIVKVLEKALT